MKKVDGVLVAFLAVLVALTILFVAFPHLGAGFSVEAWVAAGEARGSLWVGVGLVAVASFLGALVPVPVPYPLTVSIVVLWAGGDVGGILLVVAVGAVANWAGDALDFGIGAGTRQVADPETLASVARWTRLVEAHPRLTPLLVFLTALTPLPESLIFIPLGLTGYSPKKTLFWSFWGKVGMMTVAALAGLFALDPILTLLGGAGGSWVSGMLLLYAAWALMAVVLKVDFGGKPPASTSAPVRASPGGTTKPR